MRVHNSWRNNYTTLNRVQDSNKWDRGQWTGGHWAHWQWSTYWLVFVYCLPHAKMQRMASKKSAHFPTKQQLGPYHKTTHDYYITVVVDHQKMPLETLCLHSQSVIKVDHQKMHLETLCLHSQSVITVGHQKMHLETLCLHSQSVITS